MATFDKVAWGIAGLLVLVSFLNPVGLVTALIIAGVWLALLYGGRFGADIVRNQYVGAKADRPLDVQDRLAGSNNDSSTWRRK